MLEDKVLYALVAIVLATIGYIPYVKGIYKGTNKPHIFMWLIWVIVLAIITLAQWHAGAGPSTWVTGYVGVVSTLIFLWSLKAGEKHITRLDWIMLWGSFAAIPLWVLTDDPLGSVCLVTVINSMSFVPTIRKAWSKPYEENLALYMLIIPRQVLAIAALEVYSVTTVLYLASVIVMCMILLSSILYRRYSLPKQK